MRKEPVLRRLRKGLCAWEGEEKGSPFGSLRQGPLLGMMRKDSVLGRLRKEPNTWEGEEKDSLCGTVCGGGHYLAVLGKDTLLGIWQSG